MHSTTKIVLQVLLVVFILFNVTVSIQFYADKHNWQSSPHTILMSIALYLQRYFHWVGTWLAAIWSIVIIIKDHFWEFIKDFIPALWKVVHPLWLMCVSFAYIADGYWEYAKAYIGSHYTTFNDFWFCVPVILIVVTIIGVLIYFANEQEKERQQSFQLHESELKKAKAKKPTILKAD